MKQATLLVLAAMMALVQAKAEERTIDISGNNTSSDYKSYGTAISLPQGDIVNPSLANNRVTLHEGATLCGEANSNGSGFRIGELNTEAGSTLLGWYKKNRSVYYLLGGLNTDFTLAGTIKPVDYNDATLLSIVKEGTGTMTITGNDNYVSGGSVDNYGIIEPGDDGVDDAKDQNTLGYYAAKNQKNIGVALATYKGYQSDRDAAGKQFNMMVCENEMKMDALQPSQGSFSFGSADQLVSFAQKNNMVIRGHCLVWHSQQPGWVSSDGKKNDKGWTREQALAIMKNHITKVMQHYKGKVREWDVVNECLEDDQTTVRTNPDGYDLRKQSVWQLAIGDDYIDSAFVYAHRADPDAILYLNDYGVELQGKAKSSAFYNLAMRLKNDGIPIDGVGLQCHFSIGDVDSVKFDNTIRRFEEAGLKCIITELDMGIPDISTANLEEQARNYRVVTDIMLNHDNCPSMVIWGIKDNDSWRNTSNPLLYTSGLDKKPAWYAVRSALRHRTLTESGILTLRQTDRRDGDVYNLAGQKVSSDYRGLVIIDGRKVLNK